MCGAEIGEIQNSGGFAAACSKVYKTLNKRYLLMPHGSPKEMESLRMYILEPPRLRIGDDGGWSCKRAYNRSFQIAYDSDQGAPDRPDQSGQGRGPTSAGPNDLARSNWRRFSVIAGHQTASSQERFSEPADLTPSPWPHAPGAWPAISAVANSELDAQTRGKAPARPWR